MDRPVSASCSSVGLISGSEARFSEDMNYRWWLTRRWGTAERTLLFVGLNPSRADGSRDDATLRRLVGFAQHWGYDALVVINLFARISPSPAALIRCADPVGRWGDSVLLRWCSRWAQSLDWDLWCGWGNGGCRLDRYQIVRSLLLPQLRLRADRLPHSPGPLMLGLTGSGQPRHPLYAPRALRLVPFTWAAPPVIRHPCGTSKHHRER